jgi:hypothetical protein
MRARHSTFSHRQQSRAPTSKPKNTWTPLFSHQPAHLYRAACLMQRCRCARVFFHHVVVAVIRLRWVAARVNALNGAAQSRTQHSKVFARRAVGPTSRADNAHLQFTRQLRDTNTRTARNAGRRCGRLRAVLVETLNVRETSLAASVLVPVTTQTERATKLGLTDCPVNAHLEPCQFAGCCAPRVMPAAATLWLNRCARTTARAWLPHTAPLPCSCTPAQVACITATRLFCPLLNVRGGGKNVR